MRPARRLRPLDHGTDHVHLKDATFFIQAGDRLVELASLWRIFLWKCGYCEYCWQNKWKLTVKSKKFCLDKEDFVSMSFTLYIVTTYISSFNNDSWVVDKSHVLNRLQTCISRITYRNVLLTSSSCIICASFHPDLACGAGDLLEGLHKLLEDLSSFIY